MLPILTFARSANAVIRATKAGVHLAITVVWAAAPAIYLIQLRVIMKEVILRFPILSRDMF